MGRGYERLRVSALAVGATSTALAAGVANKASAAPTALPVSFTHGGVAWTSISNSTYCSQNSAEGLGITDASLTGPGMGDAFDGAFCSSANGYMYADPNGTVDLSARTITSTGKTRGIRQQVKYQFFGDKPAARALFSFTNTTNRTRRVNVGIFNNLGSDSSTQIDGSSDGNKRVDNGDAAFVSSDGAPLSDPALLWGRGNRNNGLLLAPGKNGNNVSDNYVEAHFLRLAPGQTKRVMYLVQLHETIGQAVARIPHFANGTRLNNRNYLIGMSPAVRSQVVNWNLPS